MYCVIQVFEKTSLGTISVLLKLDIFDCKADENTCRFPCFSRQPQTLGNCSLLKYRHVLRV